MSTTELHRVISSIATCTPFFPAQRSGSTAVSRSSRKMDIPRSSSRLATVVIAMGLLLGVSSRLTAADIPLPQLQKVWVKNKAQVDAAFGIDDILQVEITGLSAWRKTAPEDQKELTLYVDGVPFAKSEMPRADDDHADFRMSRTANDQPTRDAWNRLLARPTVFHRPVPISVGPRGQPPFASVDTDPKTPGLQAPHLEFVVLWRTGFWISVALGLALFFAVWKLGRESGLLRDRVDEDTNFLGTYSLARCQMAFWFLVILGAYCFIWLATGAVDILSTSALGLLGISAGTGFVSVLLDRSKQSEAAQAAQKALDQQATVRREIEVTGGLPNATQSQALIEAERTVQIGENQLKKFPSEGIFKDILNDGGGVTVHRLQMAVWTVVLGIIFLVAVYKELAMPELPGTLLGLMGLSSATYLGLKGPEKQGTE